MLINSMYVVDFIHQLIIIALYYKWLYIAIFKQTDIYSQSLVSQSHSRQYIMVKINIKRSFKSSDWVKVSAYL